MLTIIKQQKHKAILVLFAFLPLILSACQTNTAYNTQTAKQLPAQAQSAPDEILTSQTSDHSHQPVNVAILLPLSGQHKALGQSMLNAAQIALFDTGHTNFKLIPHDTEGTAEGARNAAIAAIENDETQLILGPVFSHAVKAAKPVAARARINMIAFSTDNSIAGQNTFIMGFLPYDQLRRVGQYVKNKNITNIGILTPQNNYGQIVEQSFKYIAQRDGLSITNQARFVPNSSNLAPTVRNFAKHTAPLDAVLIPAGGEDARAIANLLSHNNLSPRKTLRIGTGLFDDPALATERNLEGAIFAAPTPQARVNFETQYRAVFSQTPPRLATLAYDATALAATISRQTRNAGTHKPFNINAIKNPNGFAGIDGIFRFRNDNTIERGLAILSFQRGKIITLDEAPTSFQQ